MKKLIFIILLLSTSLCHAEVTKKDWVRNGTDIYYTAGKVGVGITPTTPFDVTAVTMDGANVVNFRNYGTGRALYVIRNIETATRPVASMFQQFATANGQPTLVIGQGEAAEVALGVNTDNSIDTFNTVILGNGSIGIGTKDPVNKIELSDATTPYMRVHHLSTAAGAEAGIFFQAHTNENYTSKITGRRDGTSYGSAIGLYTTNNSASQPLVEKVAILSSGFVGIGVAAPSSKLHVVGEANITGVSADGTGKAVCIKSDGNLGTCGDVVGVTGACTCS